MLTLFVLKLCEKNSSVNLRFKIFLVALRALRFDERAPGAAGRAKPINKPFYRQRLFREVPQHFKKICFKVNVT